MLQFVYLADGSSGHFMIHDIKGHSNHKLPRGLRHFLSFKYRYHRGDTCQYLFTIIVCAKEICLLFTVIDVRFYVLHFAYLLLSL